MCTGKQPLVGDYIGGLLLRVSSFAATNMNKVEQEKSGQLN